MCCLQINKLNGIENKVGLNKGGIGNMECKNLKEEGYQLSQEEIEEMNELTAYAIRIDKLLDKAESTGKLGWYEISDLECSDICSEFGLVDIELMNNDYRMVIEDTNEVIFFSLEKVEN